MLKSRIICSNWKSINKSYQYTVCVDGRIYQDTDNICYIGTSQGSKETNLKVFMKHEEFGRCQNGTAR